jgi:MFS family permease
VPGRLDALEWSSWHQRMIVALGVTWILDGLEASLIANVAPTLTRSDTLGLSATDVGVANSVYLLGQVAGALIFGHLADRLGRKRLFLITLALYLAATALSGLAPDYSVFLVFRLPAGSGIGGEYSAINSAIDEIVPARVRGAVDLAVNGSYWVGVALGAGATLIVLNERIFPAAIGWRVAVGRGALLGLVILPVRRHVPESPRWLLTHGYVKAAQATVERIEIEVYGARRAAVASVSAVLPVAVRAPPT